MGGKSQKRTWPPSETDVSNDEDKGWEDWDEDQRRALGKSHLRTLGALERGSPTSSSLSSPLPARASVDHNKGQILPCDKKLSLQEYEAKKRKNLKDLPLKPKTIFFHKDLPSH